MPRNYKRRTDRGGWSEEQMKLAIQDILDGKKGYKSASKAYNVPQTTLERKVNQARKRENGIINVKSSLGSNNNRFYRRRSTSTCNLFKRNGRKIIWFVNF